MTRDSDQVPAHQSLGLDPQEEDPLIADRQEEPQAEDHLEDHDEEDDPEDHRA